MLNTHQFALAALLTSGLGACAVAVPKELADARTTYDRASHGPAASLAPSDLHKAKTALNDAEQAFLDEPRDQATRDLAYVALRRSQLAEVTASRASEANVREQAEQDLQKAQAQKQIETTSALTAAQAGLAASVQKTKALEERLAKLADVKEDARGTILTLSGSVLFRSNKSTLLPAAETRLNEVSDALLSSKERGITVEGYTDSQGGDDANIALSQRRADAVRDYLVSRGYEGDRIQAHGLGKSQPIASNDNAEGRANNRRVEIVLAPVK